jgi:hypothetical protein
MNSEQEENRIILLLESMTQEIEALNIKIEYLLQLQGVSQSTIRELERK